MTNPHLPRAIWALGCVSLLMDVSSELIHSLLPVFLVGSLGATPLMLGLIEGAAEATALIVKVFSGVISDYVGKRKPLAVFGYGLGALSKPLFALAATANVVLAARLIDRVGKGLRGAPRDALVADLAPPELRGAAFGLRQSLDTIGAFLGPLLGIALMLWWANDFHAVFAVAIVPGLLAVALLYFGVEEPDNPAAGRCGNPLTRANLACLPQAYWLVVGIGALFTLARFSEAFLILRVQDGGLPLAYVPLVLIVMNIVYALAAYPCGVLADRWSSPAGQRRLLVAAMLLLIAADLALAAGAQWFWAWTGVLLWGLHMAMSQGLLAALVAATAPADLRGTAFGFFNLLSGLALLAASTLAGWLWTNWGAATTFLGSAACSALALLAVLLAWPRQAAR